MPSVLQPRKDRLDALNDLGERQPLVEDG